MSQQQIQYLEERLRRINIARNRAEMIVTNFMKHHLHIWVSDFASYMKLVPENDIPQYLPIGESERHWKKFLKLYQQWLDDDQDLTFEEWLDQKIPV
jgi:hypothetical protein